MEKSHLPGHVSREVTVGVKLEVATVSSPVVYHIYLPRLEWERDKSDISDTQRLNQRLKKKLFEILLTGYKRPDHVTQ